MPPLALVSCQRPTRVTACQCCSPQGQGWLAYQVQQRVTGSSYVHRWWVVSAGHRPVCLVGQLLPTSAVGIRLGSMWICFHAYVAGPQYNTGDCAVPFCVHRECRLLRHGHMTPSVDVYAFGIMMWEVYTREIAFRELHYGQFFETVVLRSQRPRTAHGMPEDYR